MATRRRLPLNVERTPGKGSKGFRARIKVNGKVLRGRTRRTPAEAADDARELQRGVVKRGGPDTLGEAFDAIEVDCRRRRRRPATITFYEEGRKLVEAHFGERRRVSTIRVEDVQSFVDAMLDRGNSPGTVRARLRVLRRALILAGKKPIGVRDLVVPDVEPQDPSSFLTLEEVRALLNELSDREPWTDFWMVGFLVLTGARRSEAARIRKEDVQPGRVLIRRGKKRPREVPFPENDDARIVVEELRKISDTEWLVPGVPRASSNGDGETARVEWLVRMARRVRVFQPKATLHRLRAAMATVLSQLDPPVPIPVVAHLMGHQATTAMGITGLYAQPSPAAVREAVGRLWSAISDGHEEGENGA